MDIYNINDFVHVGQTNLAAICIAVKSSSEAWFL